MGHKTTSKVMNKGDIIRVITPGAGGFGDPKTREPELVLRDVVEEKVSVEKAKELYGVVIIKTAEGEYAVDEAATASCRA